MKKNFLKKLASVLSLALVVSSITPAASASAAATPNLAKRYANVYEGKSYAYTVKDAKGYTVKWSVSGAGAEYVNLSAKTGAKTTVTVDTDAELAAKNKNATVKASFYKGGKLVKSAGDVIKVKVSATGLGIVAADADVKLDAIPAGEVVDFNRTITPANATSITTWSVTDKDGNATTDATVDGTGNFKADKVGEYVVKAVTSNVKGGKALATAEQAVKVAYAVKSAKQTTAYKVEVTFGSDVSKVVTKDNLIVTNADGVKQVVKAVSFSTDGKVVTAELYVALSDKATYTVAYADSKTSFIASKGDPVKVVVTPKTVQFGTATTFDVALFDANGVDVTVASLLRDNVTFDYDNSLAYIDYKTADSKYQITVFDYDKTVSVKATYHTWKYENNAEIKYDSEAAVFNSVKEIKNTSNDLVYTLETGSADWNKLNSTIAAGKQYKLYVKGTNQNGTKITQRDAKFETTDANVLTVLQDSVTKDVTVYGVAAGSAYIKVTYGDTVKVFPVTVGKASEATTLELDKINVTLYSTVNATTAVTVTATVKDQYGKEIDYTSKDPITAVAKSGDSQTNIVVGAVADNNKFTVKVAGVTTDDNDGVTTYEVSFAGKKAYITVNVIKVDTALTTAYVALDTTTANVDAAFDTTTAVNKEVVITAYNYNSKGQMLSVATDATYVVKDKDGKAVTSNVSSASGVLTFVAGNKATGAQAAVGTYTVTATAGGKTVTAAIVVKNTQTVLTVERKNESVEATSASAIALGGLKFTLDGDEVTSPTNFTIANVKGVVNTTAVDANDVSVSAGDTLYIDEIKVSRNIGGAPVVQTISVKMYFKVK